MWTILGGIVAIILGVLGLINWWLLFLKALASLVPFVLLVGGIIAVIIGFSSVKENAERKKEEREIAQRSEKSDES